MPVHVAENMKKVQKISKDLQQKFGREATPEEIAEEMKDKSPEFVKEILSYLQNPVSLETPVGEDGENNLGDMVEDKDATSPEVSPSLWLQSGVRVLLSHSVHHRFLPTYVFFHLPDQISNVSPDVLYH